MNILTYNLIAVKDCDNVIFHSYGILGIELSFYSGVYSPSIGFTKQLGEVSTQLVGMSGIFIGVGEILGNDNKTMAWMKRERFRCCRRRCPVRYNGCPHDSLGQGSDRHGWFRRTRGGLLPHIYKSPKQRAVRQHERRGVHYEQRSPGYILFLLARFGRFVFQHASLLDTRRRFFQRQCLRVCNIQVHSGKLSWYKL